jgi:hypothetical protein
LVGAVKRTRAALAAALLLTPVLTFATTSDYPSVGDERLATEILLLNHTGCGFTTFTDSELNAKLAAAAGDVSPAPIRFFSERGFVFDMESGLLSEVEALPQHTATSHSHAPGLSSARSRSA